MKAEKWIAHKLDDIQNLMNENKTTTFINKRGEKWGMMMVTRSTAPSYAERSWVLNGNDNGKSDPSKSLQELAEIWAEWSSEPGISYVQEVPRTSEDALMKMVVFWPIDKSCKHA